MTFRSLICDLKTDPNATGKDRIQSFASIGRITFWLLLIFLCYFWFSGLTVPGSLIDTFNIIVLYNFLKKPLDMIDPEALKGLIGKN